MKMSSYFLEKKRNILGPVLLLSLIYLSYSIQDNSNHIKRLTNFEGGVQTCFTRVNQTYVAAMLSDQSSDYLSQNFQNLTEDCLAEGLVNLEENFKINSSFIAKKLNTLASNVHWFHEEVLSGKSATATIVKSNEAQDLGARFEKIENSKEEILEFSNKYKEQIDSFLSNEKRFFYISALLFVLLIVSESIQKARKFLAKEQLEHQAQKELIDNDGVLSVKIEEILKTALVENKLYYCASLFSNFYAYHLSNNSRENKKSGALSDLILPLSSQKTEALKTEALKAEAFKESINKLWDDDSVGLKIDSVEMVSEKIIENNLHSINLENLCDMAVSQLSDKVFSQGIKLEIKIPNNLTILGRHEEVEQIFYHLLNFAINSSLNQTSSKNISFAAIKLGDVVSFDLNYLGNSNVYDIDFLICKSLLADIDAKLQLDNSLNQEGIVIGSRIKIIFKTTEKSKARLVDLKRGTKSEILSSL